MGIRSRKVHGLHPSRMCTLWRTFVSERLHRRGVERWSTILVQIVQRTVGVIVRRTVGIIVRRTVGVCHLCTLW